MASSDHHARAVFATTARLLSCLVTESLVRALYIPIPIAAPELVSVGAAVVFASAAPVPPAFFVDGGPIPTDTDVLVVVPLHHAPVLAPGGGAREIALLDPLDMLPTVYTVDASGPDAPHVTLGALRLIAAAGPGALWERFAACAGVAPALRQEIAEELASAVEWQAHAYAHPPRAPELSSPSIEWEQSIVEGHPTHPVRLHSACSYNVLFILSRRCTRPGSFCCRSPTSHQVATTCTVLACA